VDKSVAEVLAHLGAGEILMDGGNTREAGTAPDQKDFRVAAQAACQAVLHAKLRRVFASEMWEC